jgi:hypothetical protein
VETLDNILSRRGEAMPQGEQPETQQATQDTQPPAEGEQPKQEATETEQAEQQPGEQKTVPLEALHSERQKVKRYTEEVASIREEIARRDQAWEQRINKLLEAQKPQQEPPNIYENPDAAIAHAMQPHMDRVQQVLLANSQLAAHAAYGKERVTEADAAFSKAVEARQIDPADYQRVLNSPNVFAAAVEWKARQDALAEIGDDPASYKERLKAEFLAEFQQQNGSGAATNGQPKPVMPSNLAAARNVGSRTGPNWGGPPTIADIFNRKRQPSQG